MLCTFPNVSSEKLNEITSFLETKYFKRRLRLSELRRQAAVTRSRLSFTRYGRVNRNSKQSDNNLL